MKKLLIILVSIVVLLLATAFIVPIVFEDDIKASIDEALAESVNADIVWDTEDFSLSLFTNFPNATAQLNNFGVLNRAPFDGQILFAVKEFEVEVDIFSLFGDQIKISGIELVQPQIFIKVLEDGSANYDIAIASEETEEAPADTTATAFNIGIDHWQITDGHIIYDDATIPYFMELKNVQHSGSGDFTQDIFDLKTYTTADSVVVTFDGTEYVTNKTIEADAVISISDNYGKYTFKENTAKVNDFTLGFDGYLALLDDGSMDMDITYETKESTFKSLLSLVPGIYTQDFGGIESEGILSFAGGVKGKYTEETMPAFNLALQVNDAMFKYPDLPTAINNISMDLKVDNTDGNIDNTVVDLKAFHMEFGKNPIDATILIKNLVNYDMNAAINGELNLAELSQMFPMEGTTMKGLYSIKLNATGYYDSIKNKFPSIEANMSLKNGYVKTSEFPYAMEDLHFDANLSDKAGTMADFKAVVKDFGMTMDGEPFKADLTFANLDNYTWNLTAQGGIDLEKITKVFPLEGMQLAGKIGANLTTRGNMAALDAEKYDQLPTSGTVNVNGFVYKDAELPYDVTISKAKASFDPQAMRIEQYEGTVGRSDMSITGAINNYIGYVLNDNELLKGSMTMNSKLLDLNEFMTEEEGDDSSEEEGEEEYGVIQVPENIDFVMKSTVQKVVMMDMEMNNVSGNIIVRDGEARLQDLKFNLLDGQFAVNGSYNAKDINKPVYDFKLGIDNLSIPKAFENFEIIQKYVPVAKNMDGKFSTDFNVNGLLDQSMMPDLATISGGGLIEIAKASMSNSNVLSSISSLTSLSSLNNSSKSVDLKDVVMKASIKNGKLSVEPFDLNLGGYKTTISGATALDGTIDYGLKMDVPAGQLGSQFNSLVGNLSGGNTSGSTTIPVNIGLGGTATDPKPKLLMSDQKAQAKDAVKQKLADEGKDAAKDVAKDLVSGDDAKKVVGNLLGGKDKSDTTKKDSTATPTDIKKKVEEEAKDKIKNLFKKKGGGGQ